MQNINSSEVAQYTNEINMLTSEVNQDNETIYNDNKKINNLSNQVTSYKNGYNYEFGQVKEANKDVAQFGEKLNSQLVTANNQVKDFNNFINKH